MSGVNGFVRGSIVADAHVGIQPDAARGRQLIVGVNEAAFGGFEVVGG
jgi:hypothetical protein